MSRYREFVAGVSLALALSSCSAVTAENEAINNPTTTTETTISSTAAAPETTSANTPVEQARLIEAEGIAARVMGQIACSAESVEFEIVDSLGFNDLGEKIVARTTEIHDNEPIIKFIGELIKNATDEKFASIVTHETIHACAGQEKELEERFVMASGEQVLAFDGFDMVYDAGSIAGSDRSRFGAIEDGLDELLTLKLTDTRSVNNRSYSAVMELTQIVIDKAGLSEEEAMELAAESDMMTFVAKYYSVDVKDLTPTMFYDFISMYSDAWKNS